jgi:hypothetical protein
LAFEHDRFYDLVRTGQAAAAFTIHGKSFVMANTIVSPQSFITQANGLSTQNPNY